MMEKWGTKNGVKITKIPNSYGVYVEKMTASLTSSSDQYDVIWHNDDWGQLWAHLLEPTDDVEGLKYADKWGMDGIIFNNAQGQNTVVPMGQTFGVFYYRTDLVSESELPKTLDDLVKISKKLQAEGKVKFGYVGGMAMNHTWFTWFWSMWSNNCDVLLPVFERANAKLAANNWKSALEEPCMRQVAEFWWDAINTHKISPRGMPAYDRNEANAVFMAGDAAFTVGDLSLLGDIQRSGEIQGRRQGQHHLLPPRSQPPRADGLERHLGLGDSKIRSSRAQGTRQADALRHDAR